jgi:hypothetical protein
VVETNAWLAERNASIDDVDLIVTEHRTLEEVVPHLDGDAGRVELPVALAADRDGDRRLVELRVYFSTWPLTGGHASVRRCCNPTPTCARRTSSATINALASARFEQAGACEAAEGVDHLDPLGLEVLGVVAHTSLPDHLLDALHHPREIDPRLQRLEAEPAGGAHLVGQPGRGDQALRRHAAREQTVAARLLGLLDERYPRADARRIERGDQPSRAAAEDHKVVP